MRGVQWKSQNDAVHLGQDRTLNRFDGRIFSVDQVAQGEPAPEHCLFAADQMGALPDRCAVVEDNVSGVTAGLSAGHGGLRIRWGVTSAKRSQ